MRAARPSAVTLYRARARPSRHASRPSGLRSLPRPIVPLVGGSRFRGPPSAALCCRSCGRTVEPISGPRMGALICPAARAHALSFVVASFPTQFDYRAPMLAAVKATRCAGGLRPTLTAAAWRANAIASAPGETSLWSHQGKRPGPGSPLSGGISPLQKRYNRCGRYLSKRSWSDRAGGERGVRQSILTTHNREATPCSPGAPRGKGVLPASLPT